MVTIRSLGIQPYQKVWEQMKTFTQERHENSIDEIWLLEHEPVYTQGQAGKAEHILNVDSTPIIQTDRGGQVTYHAPGQLVAYVLIDLRRRNLGIRALVCQLEQLLISLLKDFNILAKTRCGAPGVYVNDKKIASIGLRVKHGCTYHGIALNVAMDLGPFANINPCGYAQLQMTQIKDFIPQIDIEHVNKLMIRHFLSTF
jgi:lipoyl(octanoyl) transferase